MKKIVVSKEELKEEKMKVNKQASHVSNQKETSNSKENKIKKPNSTLKGKVKTITFGIDNGDGNFELQEDENGFKTTKGKFTSYFAKSLDEKELVKLSKDNHEVSLNFLGKKSKIGKISKVRGKVISSKKEKSSISFENFEKGLDLNYEVHSHGIKENIIVREKQDEYSYDFSLNIGSLTPRYNEETKCIELCDNDKIIYRILSPYMKDSSEKTSFDCFYDIEQDGEVLNLTLIADASWINDDKRVLPVIIDPTIEVVSDVFEMTGTLYSDNRKLNLVGYQNVGGLFFSIINFRINRSTIIKNFSNLSKIFLKFYVKKVDKNISDNSKIIAICDGKTLFTIEKEDYLGEHFIDITDGFNSVTEDVMKIELKYTGRTNYNSFYVNVCTLLAEEKYRPKLNIEYLDEEDIQKIPENYYSLGRAGTTFINLKNGNFRHVHRDAKIDLKTLSYTINHVFDSSVYADKKLEITPAYMGKGWKTNLHQYLIKSDTFNQVLGSKDVTYIDGDGFAHKLHERWYYLVNGEKIFVNREDIFLDSDQKLKIMDYDGDIQEVNVEIKNDEGLSYISGMNLTSFKSNKKRKRYYLKYENFGSLEVDVDSNQNHLSFFYYNPNTGAKVWVEPKSVKRNSFGDLVGPTNQPVSIDIEFVNDVILNNNGTYSVNYKCSSFGGNADESVQNESIVIYSLEESSEEDEVIDLYVNEDITNLNLQIKQVESYIKNLELSKTISFYANLATLKNIENTLNLYAKQKQYMQNNKVFDTLSEDIQNAKKIFFNRCGDRYLEYMAKADGTTDFSTLKAYAESFGIVNSEYNPGNNENAQKLPATMVSAFNSGLQRFTDNTYRINSFLLAKTRELAKEIQDLSLEGSITTLSTRIESQSADYFNILNTLANYNQQLKDLQNKKDSLIEEQMRKANDFIVDKDGNALGFDGYGRLISILGSFENEINIDYGFDDENKGKLLYVTSGVETVKFNYDKESGLLKSLIDCSGRKTKFEYDDNNCLVSVKYNDSKTSSFIYENNIISFTSPLLETIELDLNTDNQLFVCQKCLEGKIDSNSKISALDSQKTISEEQYTFGINNITTIYDSFYKKTITYQFDNLGRLLHIKDNEYEEIVHYEKGLVKHTAKFKTDNSISTLEQFGLSGVTATKEFDLSKYRTTFKNDLPISNLLAIKLVLGSIMNEADISLSKFDIKVNVISSNENDTKIEEFKLVYQEVYNQTVILPIVIDRELSTTIQFSLSNTYDESEGSFFKSAELIKLESGTIYTYDEENHLIKKQDGTNTTVYEDYNENDIPLKVTNTNIYGDEVVTIYSYNSDRQLTNVEDSKGNVEEYYYNDKGRCIEKRIYNKKDASLMKVEKIEYDENGRLLSSKGSIKDQKGNYPTEEVTYLPNTNIQSKIKGVNGETTCYTYDFNTGNLLSISSSSAGVNNSTVFTYNYGLLTSLSHHGMKVDYTCDGRGRKTDIKLNGNDFVWNTYNDNYKNEELGIYHGKLTTATTSDGYYVDLIIDEKGKVRRTSFDSAQYYGDSVYEYDCENLVKVISNKTNRDSQDTFTEVLETSYDDYNNVTDFTKTINDDVHFYRAFMYDSKNRLSKEEISLQDGDVLQTEYQYDEDNRITTLDINGLFTINYDYDVLNRVKHQNIEIDKSSSYSSQKIELCHEYSYLQQDENSLDLVAEDRTKVIVRKESISEENKLIPIKIYMTETSKYNYDESGNIIEIDADDSLTRYQYDKLNRLVREDNPKLNKTITYKYDSAGNILLKKTYEYTLEDKLYSPKVDEYTYECDGWNDQLLFFNGKQFEYDKMGRPITYMDNLLEWESNGNLLSFMSEEVEAYYFYDANGIRRNKIVNDVETSFIVDGTRILRAITKNGILTYKYALNKLIGFNYNDGSNSKEYIYLRNIQGDIIAIYDDEGNEVGGYAYDAYGNHIITNDVDGIATLNPFRYRGYYYDEETGLFYCNSRYYSPELCRWLTPDSIEYLDPESINGLNLYCYCYNNPVMYVDPSGHFAITALIIGAIIGAAIGFGVAAYIDYKDDGKIFNGSVEWYDYLGATVVGGIIGAGVGAFAGMSFSATIPTGFALAQTSTGTMMLATTGSMTLTITGAQILDVAGIFGVTYMFFKGGLPNNKYQNKQWAEAMRQLDIKNRDLWQRLHKEIDKYPYSTHDNLKKLINLLKEILEKWGKL